MGIMKKLDNNNLIDNLVLNRMCLVNFACSIFLIILYSLFLIGCSSQKENGRGYRYAHGGNYYGTAPSFSPDGTKIVFGSIRYGMGDIFTINIDGTGLRRLTDTEAYEGEPRFSPDGSKIVFISERDNQSNGEIYIMNVDGSNQRRLTFSKFYNFNPSFSHNSSKIVFAIDMGQYATDIFIMDVNGSNQTRLTHDTIPKGNPHFSGDDKKIRYDINNLETDRVEIYEININGSNPTLILKLAKKDYHKAYSPNGEKIVFISSRVTDYKIDPGTRTEIFIMNSDGTDQRQITNTKTYKEHPTFSPNGKKIMFLSLEKDGRGKGQIIIMNADGSDLKVVTNNY